MLTMTHIARFCMILTVVMTSLFAISQTVVADTTPNVMGQLQAGSQAAGYGTETVDPRIVVARMIKVFLSILGTIFFVLMIYAGFLWMTAGGEEDPVNKSKQIITYAVIGLIIILSAYSITNFVSEQIIRETVGTP